MISRFFIMILKIIFAFLLFLGLFLLLSVFFVISFLRSNSREKRERAKFELSHDDYLEYSDFNK